MVARFVVSVAWIIHIVIYMLVQPPLSPFLNQVFIKLDDAWGKLSSCSLYCFLVIHLSLHV